jgi:uncharacterized protein (TIGR02594 family)
MEHALGEWDVEETQGPGSNPRVEQYWVDSVGVRIDDGQFPWCAAFLAAMLKRGGKTIPSGADAAKPATYQNYGTALSLPQVGAICVKKDSAHVGFVLAVQGDYFLMLSGNTSRTDDDSTDGGVVTTIRRHRGFWNFRMP